jgi:hypothetical protein
LGDGSVSIAAFMGLMTDAIDDLNNTKNIDYWNGSAWDDLDNATPGSDVDLTYHTSGDLSGYTVLTVYEDCGSWGYLDTDLTKDCYVDFSDFALFAADWLKCTDPTDGDCVIAP